MPPPSPVARNILQAIRDRQMTPAEFARKIQVNESYFSRLKNGSIREPTRERLQEIADALGTSVDMLLGAPPPEPDDAFRERLRAALGTEKAHLFESVFADLQRLAPADRDQALEVIATLVANWPGRRG